MRRLSEKQMKVPPHNTGKVQIGCRVTSKPPVMSADEERIQRALLGIRKPWTETALVVVSLIGFAVLLMVMGEFK
jgi:hypothetical protein